MECRAQLDKCKHFNDKSSLMISKFHLILTFTEFSGSSVLGKVLQGTIIY